MPVQITSGEAKPVHPLQAMKAERYQEAIKSLEGSKQYPERLGTGMPGNPDYRAQDYLLALIHEKMGQPAQAEEARQRIAAYSARRPAQGAGTARNAVEQWYRTTFQAETELKALQELFTLVRGSRGRPY